MWDGANFKLKIRKVEVYRNYDKSEFESKSPLFDNDEDMSAVYNAEHSLEAFLAPSNFKSYDELKKKLEKVLAEPTSGASYRNEDDIPFDKPTARSMAAPAVGKSASAPKTKAVEDDDDLSFFEKLAEDDD